MEPLYVIKTAWVAAPMSEEILLIATQSFTNATKLTPILGAEIEFYLIGTTPENILTIIAEKCAHLEIFDVKKEEGLGQYEVSLLHGKSPDLLAFRLLEIQKIIRLMANNIGLKADFSAKPFPDDYGNSLHIHISLLDESGSNVLQKSGEEESEIMLHAIGGLLEKMPTSMPIFAPYPDCYKRLSLGKDAPGTYSWGGNNRTVALRLPTTTTDPENRRIEHRVCAADVDPHKAIEAILDGVAYGIANKVMPQSEKIYGDASLEIYGLQQITNLCKT